MGCDKMVSEHFDPRQQMVWSDSVGWYTPARIPNPCRSWAAHRPSSLSGYGGGPYRQEMGVIGLGSSACKIPSRFQSESTLEPYLPRQIPDSSDLRRRRGPAELALAVSGPDRREVKVPDIVPGKIPKPASISGKRTKSMVRYEEDASDSTAVWRVLHLRPSVKPREFPDRVPPAVWEKEKTRRSEGNSNFPSTGFSVVANGWDQDPLPCSLASSTEIHQNPSHEPALDRQWFQNPKENLSQPHSSNKRDLSESTDDDDLSSSNNMKIGQMEQTKVKANLCSVEYKPRRVPGKEILEQEVYGIDPYTQNLPKEIVPVDLDWSIDDKAEEKQGVNESGDEDKINKDIAVKTNFVMAKVPDDRWLWSTRLLLKPPPWPDFCAMGCDSVAQHGGNEVLVNFHSVKSVFCDFGPEITVLDVDGEDPHTGITASISNDNPALVSCDDDEAILWEKLPKFSKHKLYFVGLLWNLPPWPDLSPCEADWMAIDTEKGAAAMCLMMAAMFGGIVGQVVVQACSGKFHPVYQFFYFDSVESLPVEPLESGDLKPENTRYTAQISVFGSKLRKKLEQAKIFMVGSRALGCEVLKNLALMGISCSPVGKLTVTDDDANRLGDYLTGPSVETNFSQIVKAVEENYIENSSQIRMREKLPKTSASFGIVSSMLVKGSARTITPVNRASEKEKPLRVELPEYMRDDFIVKMDESNSAPKRETLNNRGVEEFLFSRLGEGFKLSMKVIREVLGCCGYDIKKSMKVLMPCSARDPVKKADNRYNVIRYVATESSFSKGSCVESQSISRNGSACSSQEEKHSSRLQMSPGELIESIFTVPERSEEEPKGRTVKSMMEGRDLVQIADPAAIEAMDKKNNVRNMSVIVHANHGKFTLTDSLMTAARIIAQEVVGDVRKTDTRADKAERGITIKYTSISLLYEMTEESLKSYKRERLWGENFFDPTTKKWTTMNTGSVTCKRGFVQFYYEPIKQIIKTCKNDQKDRLWLILRKLGVTLKIDEKELMGKTLIKSVMQTCLLASNVRLEMKIFHLPFPSRTQKYHVENSYEEPLDDIYATAIKHWDPGGYLMLDVPRMIPASDKGRFYAFDCVFSDKFTIGMKGCIMGPNYVLGQKKDLYEKEIEPALKKQLIISTALMTVGIAIISWLALPAKFTIFNFGAQKEVTSWGLFFCVAIGLWAGLIIGFVIEYYTSNAYSPVQDIADSCKTGAATNVIFGLALGYKSVIVPIFAIAVSIYVSFFIAAMYSIAVVVQCKVASDLSKLVESWKRLAEPDPLVLCIMEESGKHICAGVGELLFEICLKDSPEYATLEDANFIKTTFNEFFAHTIRSGVPFWSTLSDSHGLWEFTFTDPSQLNFVLVATILRAETFGISIPDWAQNLKKRVEAVNKVISPDFLIKYLRTSIILRGRKCQNWLKSSAGSRCLF